MNTLPTILYKYLQPSRIDVLKDRRIRFTQPADFNDPFEFRPTIREVASDAVVRAYIEQKFDTLVEEELSKYGALVESLPQADLKRLLTEQKAMLPALYRNVGAIGNPAAFARD